MQFSATHSAMSGRLRAYAFCLSRLLCTWMLLSGMGGATGNTWAQGANTAGQSPLQRSKELVPTQGVLAGKTVYTNSFALVVGCGTYPNLPAHKQLDFARKDALAMRALLIRSYGFLPDNVILLLDADATRNNIEQALNRFCDKRTVRSTDRLFVYFSGHGQTVTSSEEQTDGFLIPTDAKVDLDKSNDVAGYVQTCVSMQKVRAFLEDSPAQHCLVMADACFSGFLVRGKGGKLADKALAHLASEPAYQVLAAGGRGESAWEDPKLGNSVFTYACLQSLRDNAKEEGSVTLTSELGAGVKRVVLNLTGGKQTPQAGNVRASEGEFLFVATLPQSVPDAMSGLPAGSSGVFGRRVLAVQAANDAEVYWGKKDYVEAERMYNKALELDSTNSLAYTNLGTLNHFIKKDYVEAERMYKKSLELAPNDSAVYNNLGLLYDARKNYVEAERMYKKAIELAPNGSSGYYNLGGLYYQAKNYVEAEQMYKKAIALAPNDSSVYYALGLLYEAKKNYAEAERIYKKAIEFYPTNASSYNNLGFLYNYVERNYAEAERMYKRATELDPSDSWAYAELASCLLRQEKRAEAVIVARHAKKLGLKKHSVYKELGM